MTKNFEHLIRNTQSKTLEELKKEGDELFATKQAQDASLLAAYKEKRLKSKEAIKQAKALLKTEEKAAAKKAKTSEKKNK